MKALLILFLSLAATCFCANGQEFKEGILYDVTGPVKEVVMHRDSVAPNFTTNAFESAQFNIDGKTKATDLSFDEDGYPTEFIINNRANPMLGMSVSNDSESDSDNQLCIYFKFNYDNDHRIASTEIKYHINIDIEVPNLTFNKGLIGTKTYQYAENSQGRSEISATKGTYNILDSDQPFVMAHDYSNYVYDNHGNWISRNVKEAIMPGTEQEKTWEYTETRTITYYD